MSVAVLQYISDRMDELGIPYAFVRWASGQPPGYYFVGEYFETPSLTLEENGFQESTFVLRGFTRGDWLQLEQAKEKIERGMGKTAILEDGSGVAVFYDSGTVIPSGNDELKSIKINLNIQEWKVR